MAPGDLAPLLTGEAPRLRAEREVLWADGRGMDAARLAERLLTRLTELGVTAHAGVAGVPIAAELAARWGRPAGETDGPTPFLVKERTGWGWRKPSRHVPAARPAPAARSRLPEGKTPPRPAAPDVGDVGEERVPPSPTSPTSPGGGGGEGLPPSGGGGGGRDGEGGEGGEGGRGGEGGGAGRVVVVPAGRERAWLAGLPLASLEPTERVRTLLDGVGITTLGGLATLDREAVEVRLGGGAVELWRLARADDRRLLFDRIPPERPHGSLDFVDYVLTDPSRLLFTANALLGPLCDRLVGRGEHARTLRLTLPLANGDSWERTIRPARPTSSRDTWLRLIRELLDRLTVPDAVAGMRLEVGATEEAAVRQGDLFDRGFATAAAVEAAVARLAERLVHPLVPDTTDHPLVERRARWRRASPGGEPEAARASNGAGKGGAAATAARPAKGLTLQLLPAPRPIDVETTGRRDHEAPIRLRDRRGWREVAAATGPHRISGGQWETASYAREYYHCATAEGAVLWVYRDGLDGRWYLHGWWD